jgi:hypothetical protein
MVCESLFWFDESIGYIPASGAESSFMMRLAKDKPQISPGLLYIYLPKMNIQILQMLSSNSQKHNEPPERNILGLINIQVYIEFRFNVVGKFNKLAVKVH